MTSATGAKAGEAPGPVISPLLERWPTWPSRLRSQVNLLRELTLTSFKLKYAGSALGYVWSLVKPLMLFGLMYIVFAVFLLRGRTTQMENFPAQLLVGIVAWYFFNEATHSALNAVVSNAGMVRKAYFPRWTLVAAAALSSVMTLAVNITIMMALGLTFHWYHLGWQSLLVLPLLLELCLFALGVGLLLASLYVYYRDLGHIWDVLLLFLFYASAIIFPITVIPYKFLVFIVMNPLAQIIEDIRRALVTPVIPWSVNILGPKLVVPIGTVVATLVLGALVFRRLGRRFAERL